MSGEHFATWWFGTYFILGIIFYLYFIRFYFYFLNKNKFLCKKIKIKEEKFLWGEENCWTNNRIYIAKNVFLKKNSLFNKSFHKNTIKTLFVVSGKMDIFVKKGNSSHIVTLLPKEAYEVYPETIYSISALTDVNYIEVSSNVNNDTYSCKKEKNDRQRYRDFTRKNS